MIYTKGREKKTLSYVGKPNTEVARKFIGLLDATERANFFWREFDQMGEFSNFVGMKITGSREVISRHIHTSRARFYNYFLPLTSLYQLYRDGHKLYPKRIKCGGKVYTLYSTQEVLKSSSVFEFKRWIVGVL